MDKDTRSRPPNVKQRKFISKIGHYQTIRTIGRGNFAVVKLAKHDLTNAKVAIKIIDKCRIDEENLRKVYREIQILKSLRHRHVVKLYQVMETDSKLFLVTEYASGGEVFEYLQKHSRMSEREARHVFRQIVSAVAYCHSCGVVHRDLKAENLLFDSNRNIKLVDFGFANFYQDGSLLQTWCGSPPYAAPELFLGESYDGTKADAWSLGVVLYILVCGGFPFPSNSVERLKEAVLDGQINIPFYVSVECSDLIRKLLVIDRSQRFNIRQIIQHRWFCASDWNDSWEALFRSSLEPHLTVSEHCLNHTCIFYMQQRGYLPDKIAEAIIERRFDDDYAIYYLLYDKLNKEPVSKSNLSVVSPADLEYALSDLTRRGSRGCLTTGQANVETLLETPTISTADLVKLSQCSPDDEPRSSDSEGSVSETTSINMQSYLSQRRHTALGVGNLPSSQTPLEVNPAHHHHHHHHAAFLPAVPFPLDYHMEALTQYGRPTVYLRPTGCEHRQNHKHQDFLRRSSHGNSWLTRRSAVLPTIPVCMQQQPVGMCKSAGSAPVESLVAEEQYPVEELGAKYLKAKGHFKRHTVHGSYNQSMLGYGEVYLQQAGFVSPFQQTRPYATTHLSAQSAAAAGASGRNVRSASGQFRPPSAIRRGSDSTQLTPDMLRHLENLYCTAATRPISPAENLNMRQLQQEFTQLRASTEQGQQQQKLAASSSDIWRSPRSSPAGQKCLHMIAEDDTNISVARHQQQQQHLQHCSSSFSGLPTVHPAHPMMMFVPPQQNQQDQQQQTNPAHSVMMFVTPAAQQQDQPGSTGYQKFGIAAAVSAEVCPGGAAGQHRSSAADPVANFQRFASDLLSSKPSGKPVAAVVSSSMKMDQFYYNYPLRPQQQQNVAAAPRHVTAASLPSSASFTSISDKKDTVLSSRTISFITLQLKRVLNRMKITYREDQLSFGDVGKSGLAGCYDDDSAGNSRRVSLESDDGTKVEIGVSPADNASGLSKVDFRCIEGDYGRYQELCSELLAGLNL